MLLETIFTVMCMYNVYWIKCQGLAEKLRPLVVDTIPYLNNAISAGKSVLVEGAQSNILDIDFGMVGLVALKLKR